MNLRLGANSVDGAGQMRWRIDLLVRLLDENAGRMDARTGVAFGLNDRGLQTANGGDAGADQTGEARPNDDEVEFPHALSSRQFRGEEVESLVVTNITGDEGLAD